MPPSTHLSTLLTPFQSPFNTPAWRKVQRLLSGTLLACRRRTITAALRHTGQGDTSSFSLYQQRCNRAHWSAPKVAAGGSPTFGLDETLARRLPRAHCESLRILRTMRPPPLDWYRTQSINFLVLSVVHDGIALPLFWQLLALLRTVLNPKGRREKPACAFRSGD